MAKKTLQVIESAYRGTLEEQDDTIVWLTHALQGAGADMDVLLCGHAVNYAVQGQDASGLQFGERRQTQPPRLADDLASLRDKGVTIHVVQDDLAERGLEGTDLIDGLQPVPRSGVAALFDRYEQVWHW